MRAGTAAPAGLGHEGDPSCRPPACIGPLRKRADFLRAARSLRRSTPAFMLQARQRGAAEPGPPEAIRLGITCSRKIGNSVTRNRAKRRLRAVAAAVLPEAGRPGWDYVLVGRPGATVERPFARMVSELRGALSALQREPVR
jgi:ribonuclease P protein component